MHVRHCRTNTACLVIPFFFITVTRKLETSEDTINKNNIFRVVHKWTIKMSTTWMSFFSMTFKEDITSNASKFTLVRCCNLRKLNYLYVYIIVFMYHTNLWLQQMRAININDFWWIRTLFSFTFPSSDSSKRKYSYYVMWVGDELEIIRAT